MAEIPLNKTKVDIDGNNSIRPNDTDANPSQPLLIDPFVDPVASPSDPAFQAILLDTFSAAHFLAFGTVYTRDDYFEEVSRRLNVGEVLTWGGGENDESGNQILSDWLKEYRLNSAVRFYLEARGLREDLESAAKTLLEAGRRGELILLGAKPADSEAKDLKVGQLIDHEIAPYESWLCRQTPFNGVFKEASPDWDRISFRRQEVALLRNATWHSAAKAPSKSPPQAPPSSRDIYYPLLPEALIRMLSDGKSLNPYTLGKYLASVRYGNVYSKEQREAGRSWVNRESHLQDAKAMWDSMVKDAVPGGVHAGIRIFPEK